MAELICRLVLIMVLSPHQAGILPQIARCGQSIEIVDKQDAPD